MSAQAIRGIQPTTEPGAGRGDDGLSLQMRSFGVTATLVRTDRGVVLEGVATTFYGKQMAQEIARRADLVVVANRIRVVRPAAAVRQPSLPS